MIVEATSKGKPEIGFRGPHHSPSFHSLEDPTLNPPLTLIISMHGSRYSFSDPGKVDITANMTSF